MSKDDPTYSVRPCWVATEIGRIHFGSTSGTVRCKLLLSRTRNRPPEAHSSQRTSLAFYFCTASSIAPAFQSRSPFEFITAVYSHGGRRRTGHVVAIAPHPRGARVGRVAHPARFCVRAFRHDRQDETHAARFRGITGIMIGLRVLNTVPAGLATR